MANANVQWIGADNLTATTSTEQRALFLKQFAGEVITAFEEHTLVLDKHVIRTIKSGKSAQFPVIGRMPAAVYHTPGEEITGQDIPHSERTINIDALLLSPVFLSNIDEAMSHFEVRGKYSRMMGQRLATTFDGNVMRNMILAARDTNGAITGDATDAGYVVEDADLASATADTKLAAWMDALKAIKANFDNKFVTGSQYLIVKPDDFWFLVTHRDTTTGFSLVNRDYNTNGDLGKGTLPEILGIKIISSPMLPSTDLSGESYHAVNANTTVGLAFTDQAVGTLKLMDVSIESQYDIRRQGTLMVGKYAMGHGILQCSCAAELRTGTPA